MKTNQIKTISIHNLLPIIGCVNRGQDGEQKTLHFNGETRAYNSNHSGRRLLKDMGTPRDPDGNFDWNIGSIPDPNGQLYPSSIQSRNHADWLAANFRKTRDSLDESRLGQIVTAITDLMVGGKQKDKREKELKGKLIAVKTAESALEAAIKAAEAGTEPKVEAGKKGKKQKDPVQAAEEALLKAQNNLKAFEEATQEVGSSKSVIRLAEHKLEAFGEVLAEAYDLLGKLSTEDGAEEAAKPKKGKNSEEVDVQSLVKKLCDKNPKMRGPSVFDSFHGAMSTGIYGENIMKGFIEGDMVAVNRFRPTSNFTTAMEERPLEGTGQGSAAMTEQDKSYNVFYRYGYFSVTRLLENLMLTPGMTREQAIEVLAQGTWKLTQAVSTFRGGTTSKATCPAESHLTVVCFGWPVSFMEAFRQMIDKGSVMDEAIIKLATELKQHMERTKSVHKALVFTFRPEHEALFRHLPNVTMFSSRDALADEVEKIVREGTYTVFEPGEVEKTSEKTNGKGTTPHAEA